MDDNALGTAPTEHDGGMEFEEFARKYMAAEGFELAPWQERVAKAILEGGVPSLLPRWPNKREAHVMACALAEIEGKPWDVVGASEEEERTIRREARELAARLTSG